MDDKPRWMAEHEASDLENFKDIREALQRIEVKIDPIFENYTAASRIAKWGMGLMMMFSVMLGIALAMKNLFGK